MENTGNMENNLTDPISYIEAAIIHERMEDLDCPMAYLMGKLLSEYKSSGDKEALDYALKIARESLTPKKVGLLAKIRARFLSQRS